jgi:hypothetical protein
MWLRIVPCDFPYTVQKINIVCQQAAHRKPTGRPHRITARKLKNSVLICVRDTDPAVTRDLIELLDGPPESIF